jgi:putative ABC transport system permease protein
LQGGTADMERIFSFSPEFGTFFTEEDIISRGNVVVLGYKLATEIFGNSQEALNKKIKIKDLNFLVIGVLPQKGQTAIFGIDNNALVPITTLNNTFLADDNPKTIIIETENEKYTQATEEDVKRALYFTRGFEETDDKEKIDFQIQNQQDIINTISSVLGAFNIFLTSVAAISLVVGGIGIMNIMLVSVTERTREIGLRKSLGATNKDILKQFLLEATVLTGLGGIIGSLLGALLSYVAITLASKFAGLLWTFEFPYTGMMIGVSMSVLIGLVFGIYPARKASQKSPTEALRYE